jgi:hypothetical protein
VDPNVVFAGYAVQRRAPAVEWHVQLVDPPPTDQALLLDGGVGWWVGAHGDHQLVPWIVRIDRARQQERTYPPAIPAPGVAHRRPPDRDRDVQLGDPSARHPGSSELDDVADHQASFIGQSARAAGA